MRYKGIAMTVLFAVLFLFLLNGCGEGDIDDSNVEWQPSAWDYGSWNNRIRDMVIRSTRLFPFGVSEATGLMIDILWPRTGRNIWAQIAADVQATIDREIVKNVIRERQSELDALTRNIKSYTTTQRLTEKGNYLTVCLADAVRIFYKITNDKEHDAQLAPIAASLAAIHISLLRERYEHGDKLYPKFVNKDPMWLKELLDFYDEYILYFYGYDRDGNRVGEGLLDRWEYFRRKHLVDKHWLTPGIVKNSCAKLTDGYYSDDAYAEYRANNNSIKNYWKKEITDARVMIMAHEKLKFADEVMSCVAVLCRMLPERSHPDAGENSSRVNPHLKRLFVGPITWHTVKSKELKKNSNSVDDPQWVLHNDKQPGTLYRVFVRSWNAIDGVQLQFSDGYTGPFIGNPNGGVLHEDIIRPEGDYFSGFGFSFGSNFDSGSYLYNIKFYTSNSETRWMSKFHGPGNALVRAQNYEVVGAGFKSTTAQQSHGNIRCVYLWFAFRNPPTEEPKQTDSLSRGD
jgi:hypothetical protein